MKNLICTLLLLLFFAGTLSAKKEIKITTWNLEHLGSDGRGLGGIGAGSLGNRTEEQLHEIATLIRDTLRSDILAIQEVAVNNLAMGLKVNNDLEKIKESLGDGWEYVIGSAAEEVAGNQVHNMQNAFLWNTGKVRLIRSFDLAVPNISIDENAFDRIPFAAYFEAIDTSKPDRTDFLLINVHLKSGQDNDENHLGAMIIIVENLKHFLKMNEIKESDIAILGDFNDNPWDERYIDLLYRYMEHREYTDLTREALGATRMDEGLTSIIDHIMVNKGMQEEMEEVIAEKYMPSQILTELAIWRQTYSDHFPVSCKVKVRKDSDVDW